MSVVKVIYRCKGCGESYSVSRPPKPYTFQCQKCGQSLFVHPLDWISHI